MTRSIPRASLHSSQMIRSLVELDAACIAPAPADLAQTLGQWISFVDASALSALQTPQVMEVCGGTPAGVSGSPLSKEFIAWRCDLEAQILQIGRYANASTRLSLPVPTTKHSVQEASDYAPYRRYHYAHQQNMEVKIRQVRAKVRDQVAKASPKLKQLAELDATLERILDEREAGRLGNVPPVLERRFKHLLKTHQQTLPGGSDADSVAFWLTPEGWLSRFHNELQTALHAELDLRLQTTVGLIEAYDNEQTHNV